MSPDNLRIGVVRSIVKPEAKFLFNALQAQGVAYESIDDRTTSFGPDSEDWWHQFDAVLMRSISFYDGLNASRMLHSFGIPVINTPDVAAICGDKSLTSAKLHAAKVLQPKWAIALNQEQALLEMDKIGYPVVMKPVVGSWGRGLEKIDSRDAAKALFESKRVTESANEKVIYMQKYVNKPGRDIRSFVVGDKTIAAIYRTSPHWITNTARGGVATNCSITDEINELSLQAARAVGGGERAILAMDLFEDEGGIMVNEINHTMEFKNSITTTGVDIPGLMIAHVLRIARGEI